MGKVILYDSLNPTNKIKGEILRALYSVEDYTKVELQRMYPAYHPIDGEEIPKDLSAIRRWMERECAGEVIIKQQTRGTSSSRDGNGGSLYLYAHFELEEDAIQYKLTWEGK